MASQPQLSDLDAYKALNITLNSDGSLTRATLFPSIPANHELTTDSQLTLSKDIPLNPTTGTFLRLYRPVTPPNQKLPIIIYFHGGAFVYLSATVAPFHLACCNISVHSPALVISTGYRLAPEHRLPAAYDDGVDAIMLVHDQALRSKVDDGCDEWFTELADFSKVYLMGISAGGNQIYNVGLRALDLELDPVMIVGLIIDQPFFGGVERTEYELQLENDLMLPLAYADAAWHFALPLGSDRDHKYCNPFKDQELYNGKTKKLPKCLIRVHGGDPLVDRTKKFANMLEASGVHVIRKYYEQGYHGIEYFDSEVAKIMYDDVKNFIHS